MASLRTGYGLPARPSDGYRPRRSDDSAHHGSIPRPINRISQRDAELPRAARQVSSPSKISSRVPQPHSAKGSVLPRPSPRTAPETSVRSPTTRSRTSSETSRSHNQTASSSSSSGRSLDMTSRTTQASQQKHRVPMSRDMGSFRKDSKSPSVSNSAKSLQRALDPGLGIQFDQRASPAPDEVQGAEPIDIGKSLAQPPVIYPELDRYRDFQRPDYTFDRPEIDVPYRLATQDLPPPTPMSQLFSGGSSQVSAVSGSPSTKFSESPGPGPYSRDTTPTSMSSQSPGFATPSRAGVPHRSGRQHSMSTTRPPVTRRRAGSFPNEIETTIIDPHGLASVRESLTSSSSNSTVKDGDRATRKDKAKTRHLPPPPPSPPPRKSSQKFRKPKESSEDSKLSKSQGSEQRESPGQSKPRSPSRSDRSSPLQNGPPARPSRHNTPDMKSQLFSPVPVIQSNLISTIRTPEGRGNGPLISTSLPGSTTSLPHVRQNASASNLSLGHESFSTSSLSRSSLDKGPTTLSEPNLSAQPTQSSSRSSSRSRFPFFSRKKATSNTPKQDEHIEKKKLTRKGPVAGTGHEGYGRVGAVRRRSGSGSALPRSVTDPVSSYDSLTSADSFLTDRMNPVIISGGEVIENRNASAELSRSETNQSLPGRPSIESKVSSEGSSTSRNESKSGLRPSALPRDQTSSPRRPSDSSGSDEVGMESTLAFRRSVQRLRSSPDSPLRLPQPIKTTRHGSPSPLTSVDTSLLSDESQVDLPREVSQDTTGLHPAPKKKAQEKTKVATEMEFVQQVTESAEYQKEPR